MASINEEDSKQPSNMAESVPTQELLGVDGQGVDTVEFGGEAGRSRSPSEVSVVVPKEDPDNVMFLRKGFNQNIVAGIVAFAGPGLFNAMQGLGNAGGSDPSVRCRKK